MRVKVNDEWYSTEDDNNICVEFTDVEVDQVKSMDPASAPNNRFAVLTGDWDRESFKRWLGEDS